MASWLLKPRNIVFLVTVIIVLGLLWRGLTLERRDSRIDLIATLVLVLATVTYAWLTISLVEEARESRMRASTPDIVAWNGGGNMASWTFHTKNAGNAAAINVEMGLRGSAIDSPLVLAREASIPLGNGPSLHVNLQTAQYQKDTDVYQIVARYSNVFGDAFEALTDFPKHANGHPDSARRHLLRRV